MSRRGGDWGDGGPKESAPAPRPRPAPPQRRIGRDRLGGLRKRIDRLAEGSIDAADRAAAISRRGLRSLGDTLARARGHLRPARHPRSYVAAATLALTLGVGALAYTAWNRLSPMDRIDEGYSQFREEYRDFRERQEQPETADRTSAEEEFFDPTQTAPYAQTPKEDIAPDRKPPEEPQSRAAGNLRKAPAQEEREQRRAPSLEERVPAERPSILPPVRPPAQATTLKIGDYIVRPEVASLSNAQLWELLDKKWQSGLSGITRELLGEGALAYGEGGGVHETAKASGVDLYNEPVWERTHTPAFYGNGINDRFEKDDVRRLYESLVAQREEPLRFGPCEITPAWETYSLKDLERHDDRGRTGLAELLCTNDSASELYRPGGIIDHFASEVGIESRNDDGTFVARWTTDMTQRLYTQLFFTASPGNSPPAP